MKATKEPDYVFINSETTDSWVERGWKYGKPISHKVFLDSLRSKWNIFLTPGKPMPHDWLPNVKGKKILGVGAGGGQQMAILAALGAEITLLDNSQKQLDGDELVAQREKYYIRLVKPDMTQRFPLPDNYFDLIINPMSLVYVRSVEPVFNECSRVMKTGGVLLSGLDNGLNFAFDDEDVKLMFPLPLDPLEDKEQYDYMARNNYGIQFTHTISEQLNGLIRAGFSIADTYEDTNVFGKLKDFNIPAFLAIKAIKN